jgi:type IV secretory pathway VirB10-like protein
MNAQSTPTTTGRKTLRLLLIAGAVLGVLVLIVLTVRNLMAQPPEARKAPKITLVAPPPPPPPPPPPKFEKKPDPPKEQKEMKVDQPVPKQDSPPPSPELKMDGPAGSGQSGFGQGKITNDDLSKVNTAGPGGTGKGSKHDAWEESNYLNLAKGEVSRYLRNATKSQRTNMRYTAEFLVWASPTGAIQRFELLKSNGDAEADALISEKLSSLSSLSAAPPPNMEQPLRLRVRVGA